METSRHGPTGETIDAPRHRALGSTSRASILRLVRAAGGGLTTAEVAESIGLHLSTTRAHLDRLTEAGLLVKARASGGQAGRPAWRYRAVTGADPAPAPYRALTEALLDHLSDGAGDTRARATQVGQGWGRQLAAALPPPVDAVAAVVGVLDGLGFDPQRQPEPPEPGVAELHLRTCPFLELVARNPDAMCGLHAGVVRGVLEHAGAPDDPVALEPFGAPHACLVRIPHATGTTGGGEPAARSHRQATS